MPRPSSKNEGDCGDGAEDFRSDERLAVYGSLAPGEANAHLLAGIDGCWLPASVRATLCGQGWASARGYPGIRLDPKADEVSVRIFCSKALPSMWAGLDRFEGPDYRRVVTIATASGRPLAVNIYELAN